MKSKLAIIIAAFALTGCMGSSSHIEPAKTEYRVVMPEDKYFECKEITLPNPDTLTDAQVALLVNDLVKENKICANNSKATKEFLLEAKKRLEKPTK